MRINMKAIITGAIIAASHPASAAVITFDSLAFDGNGSTPAFQANSVIVDDYLFTGVIGGTAVPDFAVYAKGDPRNADPGGAALGLTEINRIYTMSRLDGAAFDVSSIDVSQLNNDASGGNFSGLVTFLYDGVTGPSFSHDGIPGYQTFALAGTGIHTLGIRTINSIAIDNIVVSGDVPETKTWAMLVMGFGFIGSALRRGRKPATASAA